MTLLLFLRNARIENWGFCKAISFVRFLRQTCWFMFQVYIRLVLRNKINDYFCNICNLLLNEYTSNLQSVHGCFGGDDHLVGLMIHTLLRVCVEITSIRC